MTYSGDDSNSDFNRKLLKKLYKVRLIAPSGFYHFTSSIFTEGVNLMVLMRAATKLHSDKIALVDEMEEFSYRDLYSQTKNLACVLHSQFELAPRQKAAFICRNHASFVRSLFAVSRVGADIFLLNPEMSAEQFDALNVRHKFNLVIHDAEVADLIVNFESKDKAIPAYRDNNKDVVSIDSLSKTVSARKVKIKKSRPGNIVVLTGGTTGQPKAARRKPSVFNFLNPFFALLVKLDLDVYKTSYIATPAYHGFGLASIFMSLILGIKMHFLPRFNAEKSCDLIERNDIEIVTLVPLMLQRMTNQNADALSSLRCIISGGAPLNPMLVEQTFERLGDKLFNLYGTSEAGFSIMATPADLRYDSRTIGKKINGVKLKILDANDAEAANGTIGRICIKSKWSTSGGSWVETGDIGYRDELGYYFHCGRSDEMVVSAGEKVYPIELENILMKHPDIEQVAVVGISDAEFGQRLKAFIVRRANSELDAKQTFDWLSTRTARFQTPAKIEFLPELPVTAIGKINKKALLER